MVSLGLGSYVAVNAIFGLPSLTECRMILDFNENKAHSKLMQIQFPLSLTEASTGLQKSIDFAPDHFVLPNQQTYLEKSFVITQ